MFVVSSCRSTSQFPILEIPVWNGTTIKFAVVFRTLVTTFVLYVIAIRAMHRTVTTRSRYLPGISTLGLSPFLLLVP